MTYNMQLDDAMQAIEDLLNSSKATYVMDTIKQLKNATSKEHMLLD